ncbi:MAG TPA: hypothetical protein VHA52_00015, partial [Candidatus Babeliaceae bacterium]|nr:hypothetical protein [Candidatus Babeliaceae bacterium]
QECLVDVQKIRSTKNVLSFDKSKSFGLDFMSILGLVLGTNMLSSLKGLNFNSSNLGYYNEELKYLMKGLTTNTAVEYLDLGNTYTCRYREHGDIFAICEMLKSNKTLQELNLSSLSIDDSQADLLQATLRINHTLKKIDLSKTSITKSKAQELKANFPERVII